MAPFESANQSANENVTCKVCLLEILRQMVCLHDVQLFIYALIAS